MKLRMLSVLFAAIFAAPALAASSVQSFDTETVGAEPKSFTAAVGNWVIVDNGGNKALSVNGSQWARGQTSAGLADKARALYGERYAEFLDNVQSYAYFPIAVMNEVADFRNGAITLRFKGVAGRIDQAAGILFNVQPNGDYLATGKNHNGAPPACAGGAGRRRCRRIAGRRAGRDPAGAHHLVRWPAVHQAGCRCAALEQPAGRVRAGRWA